MMSIATLNTALVDRYQVERELGSGGMATVYLARDVRHQRRVALKVLRPELSSAMGVERFPREIHIIAQLQHPHVLPLYDSGEAGGFLYYVMPYVEGETLRARLARGPLSVSECVRLLTEIIDALAYAHRAGVVHRDIKPDNVMLSEKHATVMDFGIAKAVERSTTDKLTTVGIAVGTPHYMAPEQAMADATTDHRADIYAIGILGYEMLTGRPTFDAPTAQAILSAHVLEPPPDVRSRRPDVPAPLAAGLLKCLEKDPGQRWQRAEELLAVLEQVAATPSGGITPTNTRPLPATTPPDRQASAPVRGRRRWIAIGGGVAVIGLAGIVVQALGALGADGRIEKIGVMPIEDISGQDSVFVNGMQDGLTSALLRLGLVGVESRSVMMRYRGAAITTRDVARENGLSAVIEATVFREGEKMRINIQMTDPLTTRPYWSDTYERDVTNVLSAQADVVERVASGIKSVLTAQRQ